ncbi:MAG TPA: glycosyltransferase [Bryobacteraceae bacterium]|nr:glycosyltransferase [Bryobacteraceae bacterium]
MFSGRGIFLAIAAIPFIYYLIALYSSWRYFRQPEARSDPSFIPPISILKPIRGVDPDAWENLVSFCRLDYPKYEILFCVDADDRSVLSLLDRLMSAFPDRDIRVLHGSGRVATNDKTAKLSRLVSEAKYEHVVISDSDVRVRPDYLREVIAPLRNPKVGATTCIYVPTEIATFTDRIQTIGMMSDFYAGCLVDWQLEGIKFALGPTIATTRERLAEFGGYAVLENRPADDLLVGRFIAEKGHEVVLLRYAIETVCDYGSFSDLLHKRLRWMVVMRHMRAWGHFGLAFTQGLPLALLALLISPSLALGAAFIGVYLALRLGMGWMIGIRGLGQQRLWKELPLIPIWDAVAFGIWVASFGRNTIRWRGVDYFIREGGSLVPAEPVGVPVGAGD